MGIYITGDHTYTHITYTHHTLHAHQELILICTEGKLACPGKFVFQLIGVRQLQSACGH
jgi:3-mercaptopyruvate sulfurtransferase SseA